MHNLTSVPIQCTFECAAGVRHVFWCHTHSPCAARAAAPEMLADILSERGYSVTWQTQTREIPVRLQPGRDPSTNEIVCTRRTSMQFRITFERPQIRTSGGSSTPKRSSLIQPALQRAPEIQRAAEPAPGDSTVCHNVNLDGTPGCFRRGSDEEIPSNTGTYSGEEPLLSVTIPGLPDNGRIERPPQCQPLPDWAIGRAEERSKGQV